MKSNDTHLNILCSYAYLEKSKAFTNLAMDLSMSGAANVMIDSGAFTLFNAKQKRDWLTLDNYCRFLDLYGHKVEKYVMLDVIGNHQKSKDNYETMIKRGYNPMFVFTMHDNDFDYLKDASKNNEHMCIAGGVTTKGDWMRKRIQDSYKATNGKLHALGYVTYPNIYQLPLHSVDSSSWIQGAQVYGNIPYFDNGLKSISYRDILLGKKKVPAKLIQVLEKIKVTTKEFSNLSNHRGKVSIGTVCSIIAHIEYQQLSKRQNLNLFLAVALSSQLAAIAYVNEHYMAGTLTYQNFKKV